MYDHALDTFMAVAESGSFTKASERLFISHTAVIKQINGLEDRLKVRLFSRSNQGAALTAAGLCLYEKTLEIMDFSEQAVREIQAAHSASTVTIRVGTSLFYPCHIFMDLWTTISDKCPQYRLQIVPIEDDEKRFDGLNRAYDILIGPYNAEIGGADYPFLRIGEYRFCLAMPRKHPLAERTSLRFKDLSGERLIIMTPGTSEVNDRIRAELTERHPDVILENTSPHYSMRTFNQCMEKNAVLLSLECWDRVHPGLVTVPLDEPYALPYGILTAKNPPGWLNTFIRIVKDIIPLSASGDSI